MGLDIGLEAAGIETRLACESWPRARETIRANTDIPILDTIVGQSADRVREAAGLSPTEEIFLVSGGPPCQSFSSAGARRGTADERGGLLGAYIGLAIALDPLYVLMENVQGLLSATHGGEPVIQAHAVRPLEDAGYRVTYALYNAADYGVPQTRKRVILVATRHGGSPVPVFRPTTRVSDWVTFRQATEGLAEEDAEYMAVSERTLRYFRLLSEGQNWKSLPKEEQKAAMGKSYYCEGGQTGHYRRLHMDRPSPTLLCSPGYKSAARFHPTRNRYLSVQEYARIQGFPDDWVFRGSVRAKYKQIGNAVPVGLGRVAGEAIIDHHERRDAAPWPEWAKAIRHTYSTTNLGAGGAGGEGGETGE